MRKSYTSNTGFGRAHQAWLYTCFAVLVASGAAWLVLHYFGRVTTAIGDAPHPGEAWCMRIHGLAAMLSLVLFGSMMPVHMRKGWTSRKSRRSGAFMAAAMAILALTGYGLYYLVDEGWRAWVGIAHWSIGLALLPGVLIHLLYRRTPHAGPGARPAAHAPRHPPKRGGTR